jgi:protein TonB
VDTEPELEPPGLPPAAPRPPAAIVTAAVAPAVAPPDVTEVTDLNDKIPDKVEALALAGPTGPIGPPAGPPGGTCLTGNCATAGIGSGSGVRTFHASELVLRNQVQPVYPEAARALDLGDVTCKLRVFIDEKGKPYDINFTSCPPAFQKSAQDAVMRWRWDPARLGDEAVAAQFVLKIEYRLR